MKYGKYWVHLSFIILTCIFSIHGKASSSNIGDWDMVAVTRMDVINRELKKLSGFNSNFETVISDFLGTEIPVSVNITTSKPQVMFHKTDKTYWVDVEMSVNGKMRLLGRGIEVDFNDKVIITTDLTVIYATTSNTPGEDDYDVIINFDNPLKTIDVVKGDNADKNRVLKVILAEHLKQMSKKHKTYKVMSFSLANYLEYKPLVPKYAALNLVYNYSNPNKSNFIVMMSASNDIEANKKRKRISEILFEDEEDFKFIVSNKTFIKYAARPALVDTIYDQTQDKDKDRVKDEIVARSISGSKLYEVYFNGKLDLELDGVDSDLDPELRKLSVKVASNELVLKTESDADYEVCFIACFEIDIDIFHDYSYSLHVNNSQIYLEKIKGKVDYNTDYDDWNVDIPIFDDIVESLMAAILNIGSFIDSGMFVNQRIGDEDLGKAFEDVTDIFKFPQQQYITIKRGGLNNNIELFGTVSF